MDWSKFESSAIKPAIKDTQAQHLSKTTHLENIRNFTLALTLGRFINVPPVDWTPLFAKRCILRMENVCYLATLSLKPLFWHVPKVYGHSTALQEEHPSFWGSESEDRWSLVRDICAMIWKIVYICWHTKNIYFIIITIADIRL